MQGVESLFLRSVLDKIAKFYVTYLNIPRSIMLQNITYPRS